MKTLYRLFKFFCYAALFLALLAGGGVYYLFWHFSKDLPKLDSLKDYNPPVVSEVFANDGTKIGEFWSERRIILEQDQIPKLMEQAIIASEDDRFFEHSGIDYFGIARAMVENLKAGRIVQGGSTITQQVVKSFLLTKERTYERKIKEAILSKRLEDNFSKHEILYLYLNQTFFGNRAYGIEAAAQNYFHKNCKELNIAEAAMIAGLAKAPSQFNPLRKWQRAKERQEYVILRMQEEGFISEEQMARAIATPLKLYSAPIDKEYNMRYAPWFVEEVRRSIMKEYGDMVPYTRGLKIETTLDLKAQHAADKAIAEGLAALHKRHGYAGPSRHLESSEIENFNRDNHRKIFLENIEYDFHHGMNDDAIAAQPTILKKDKMYEGVITAMDKNSLSVQVGKISGTIVNQDYGWARKRNPNSTYFYEGKAIFVRDPSGTFSVGDVIEVKKIDPESDPKVYTGDKTYFSLEQTPQPEMALFAHDPWTGYVKAMVGGKNYEKSEFNRATQSVRQTGSVFKALLYGAAISKGYEPETSIMDAPLCLPDGMKNWCPKNFGGKYSGPISFRSALTNSVNVASVRIVLDIGTHYATGFIRNLGISTPIAKVPSMALGANDMKLADVVHAIGAYPTGGILQDLVYVKKITDRFGTVMEENLPRPVKNFVDQIKDGDYQHVLDIPYDESNIDQILRDDLWANGQKVIESDKLTLSPEDRALLYGKHIPTGYAISPYTAYTMVDVMQDIVNKGTATRVKAILGRPAAGKTGTTNDLTDVWFVGYVPDVVAGVWVGYDENKNKVGHGEQGGRTAAPVFAHFMKDYLEGTPVKDFEVPADYKSPVLQPPSNIKGSVNKDFIEMDGLPGEGSNRGGADFFLDDI